MEQNVSNTTAASTAAKESAGDKSANTFQEILRRDIGDASPVQSAGTLREEERSPQPRVQQDGDRAIPQRVAAKFLRKGDQYYFTDMTLAFIDEGKRLRAETENRAVLKDLVAIARARGWQAGLVNGSESFRREVWKEAFAEGLQVDGYKPSELELQAAQRERERRARDRDDEVPARPEAQTRADAASRVERAIAQSTPASRVRYGRLVDHGEAPYQFEPSNPQSYYLQLDHGQGAVRTYWGVGLAEALRSSRTSVSIGDEVGVARIGSSPVTVTTHSVDARGEKVIQKVAAHRNDWVIEKAPYFEDPERAIQDIDARREPARRRSQQHRERSKEPEGRGQESRLPDASEQSRFRSVRDDHGQIGSQEVVAETRRDIERLPRDLFVDAFVRAGLIRSENREHAVRVYEAVQAFRGRHGHTPVIRLEELRHAVDRAVLKAAEDLGRRPITREPDGDREQIVAARSSGRGDDYVRM